MRVGRQRFLPSSPPGERGELAFPAAYAAGCIEIAAPQLCGESIWRTERKLGFIAVEKRGDGSERNRSCVAHRKSSCKMGKNRGQSLLEIK